MKFLVIALCVYAANAASLGVGNSLLSISGSNAGANAASTAANILAAPGVAAANVAANSAVPASRSRSSPSTKVVATPAVTAAKVVATPAVTAARVVASPAATAAKVVATPAVTATKTVATPAVTATNTVATPAVSAAKVVATPAVAATEVAAAPVVAEARAAPASSSSANADARAAVIRDESDVKPDGYTFGYETENGIVVESTGTLKKVNEVDALVIEGSYEYIAEDGSKVKVTYVADENGFRAQSDRLPVAPPTPQAILDALQFIATHPKWVDPTVKN